MPVMNASWIHRAFLPLFLLAFFPFVGSNDGPYKEGRNQGASLRDFKGIYRVLISSPDSGRSLKAELADRGVSNGDFYRRELYTWVSEKQIGEIEETGRVLLDDDGDQGELDLFEDGLSYDPFEKHPIARILSQDAFRKKRFAWVHGWPIALGLKGDTRTGRLLRIRLKKEALIARINPHYPDSVRLVNDQGVTVPPSKYKDVQERIAAVYYVNDAYDGDRFENPEKQYSRVEDDFMEYLKESFFRGYILVNEAMIAGYSRETGMDKLRRERRILGDLKHIAGKRDQPSRLQLSYADPGRVWGPGPFYKDTLLQRYVRTLAYPRKEYYLESERIQFLIDRIEKAGPAGH